MKAVFSGKRIAGVLAVLPANIVKFDDEVNLFRQTAQQTKKLKLLMGFNERRIVEGAVCTSDLIERGFEHLVERGRIKPELVDGLVVVTESPDYFLPPTSSVLHGKLGLSERCYCVDINQGCVGFIIGLLQALFLLENTDATRVLVGMGDTLSRKVSKQDRNSWPLIGDAAGLVLVENDPDAPPIYVMMGNRGKDAEALMIPAGGFRHPSTPETRESRLRDDGNIRSDEHLVMKGGDVFNFTQTVVPAFINELLVFAGTSKDQIDKYFMHQANRFILQKIAEQIGLPFAKVPAHVVSYYGNSSAATIPVAIATSYPEGLGHTISTLCCGFGVGLTWGGMVSELGPLDFCGVFEDGN